MSGAGGSAAPELRDVPETMLWTLHSRASEAMRGDGVIRDEKALEIYRSLDYDYQRSFGRAEPTLAMRAGLFDQLLRDFLQRHPDAVIVNLGEGLETQRYRVDAPEALWISVDLPEAMEVRERFIKPDARHLHLAQSASDLSWMDQLPAARPLYVSAQGLFMYFEAAAVRELLQGVYARRSPECCVFDVIPAWLARLSRSAGGLPRTPRYRIPEMPWGVSRFWLRPTLQSWLGHDIAVTLHDFPALPRGPARMASKLALRNPLVQQFAPSIVELRRAAV